MPLLQLKNLSFSYAATHSILSNLDLTVYENETLLISGPNGSGKTTLFRCITGLENIISGEIRLYGDIITGKDGFQKLRRHVGYALQNSEDQLFFPTVIDDVSFGPLNLGKTQKEAEKQAMEALRQLGIADYADKSSWKLSGGEKKKIAIAAILAMEPNILLLDEPFNGLDTESALNLRQILQRLPCAKIIISHDENFLMPLKPEILKMRHGKLYKGI